MRLPLRAYGGLVNGTSVPFPCMKVWVFFSQRWGSMRCLGIETSCDETALALIRDGVLEDAVLASQADLHALFGGVVPELASREHYRFVGALYDALMCRTGLALDDLDAIAVTRGPGLLGALLVGVAFAKGLALGGNKPLIGVNHLHAHLLVAGLESPIAFPALGLLVSGGHTHIYHLESPTRLHLLGKTLDDAAGEACDKFAKMLGLPYPGGALLDRLGQGGQVDAGCFPRPYTHTADLDFSFSGLKTAAMTYLQTRPELPAEGGRIGASGRVDGASSALRDLAASYLFAVADTLRLKLERALQRSDVPPYQSLVVAGGVAANSTVRAVMGEFARKAGLRLHLPALRLCTDNAIMIAYTGWLQAEAGQGHGLNLSTIPRGRIIPDDTGPLRPWGAEIRGVDFPC